MFHPTFIPRDPRVRITLLSELSRASQDPALAPLLRRAPEDLPVRFTRYHAYLTRLPRRMRRLLQRQWRRSLSALALLLALGQAPALAATINVTTTNPSIVADGKCSLIEAIDNANAGARPHSDCTAGDAGADTIQLPANSIHTLVDNGLSISTAITIEGHGSTIRRDPADVDQFGIVGINNTGNLTLNETTVSGGVGFGGGVNNHGTLTLTDSIVSGNSGDSAGGVWSSYGTVTLTNSTVSGNSADHGSGGLNIWNGDLTLINSTVSGNSGAPGIYGYFSSITLIGSTVSGNRDNGVRTNTSSITLTNSTISGNDGNGVGAIFGDMTLTHCTVSGNSGYGLVIGFYNHATLNHTLISGNSVAEVYSDGGITADNYNLFGHDGNAGVIGFTPGPTDLVTNKPLNAILSPLSANGGPTQTHALVAGSPAIDASPENADCPATDQRGVTRPQGADCDIGAFERDSTVPARLIYGVQDTEGSNSQFFTIDEASHAVTPLGKPKRGRDIEGLDLHPTTGTLYGTAGADNHHGRKGFLFTIDKHTGALTPVGPTGFKSVEALSFRPTDGTLWGWAEGHGLVTINLTTGAATKVMGSAKGVEGLAWNNKGTRLYAAAGHTLFVYRPATNRLSQIASNLPGRTEALEMRPDGLLAVGVEGSTDIQAYDPIAKQPVPAEAIPTGFNDVEGIAWPEATPD